MFENLLEIVEGAHSTTAYVHKNLIRFDKKMIRFNKPSSMSDGTILKKYQECPSWPKNGKKLYCTTENRN